jgi:Ca2+:H+ antiporter
MKNIKTVDAVLYLLPIISFAAFLWLQNVSLHGVLAICALAVLLFGVVAAVHHAEVIAHRIGEPFGTLVLALAVTVIETSLLISMLFNSTDKVSSLPRDTIYATVMIICNGVVGLCLLIGGLHHREQYFKIEGTGSGFAALAALSVLVLIMPLFTVSSAEGTYTNSQLLFVGGSSLLLWIIFVFIQTVRHRDYFLPESSVNDESIHASPPGFVKAWISFILLLVALVSVVGLAKLLSPSIEVFVKTYQAPKAVVGIIIALIVLLPETWAALRAAKSDRLQTSMNLAVGSALASIGLTIPLVIAASVIFNFHLNLGLEMKDVVLLSLSFLVGTITLGSGRTNVMQGAIHLVLFFTFLFLTLVP